MSEFRINGIGCSLLDFLYSGIDFNGYTFGRYQSKEDGDGGLSPGKLVFAHEFERFSGRSTEKFLKEITGNRDPDSLNVGGPCIVALIHASQMLHGRNVSVSYYGFAGTDPSSDHLFSLLSETPLDLTHYRKTSGITPYTLVLSDPSFHEGRGERAFINHLGVAWDYRPESIDPSFYEAEITVFGGTALVPHIHDNLHQLLLTAKSRNSVTLVNTVYDFRNEKLNPGKTWPLGDPERSFPLIDLLIVDREEAVRITGALSAHEAAGKFINSGVDAFIITNGANPVLLYSGGRTFGKLSLAEMPVSEEVTGNADATGKGDTTGCGDNFVGGVLASMAVQMMENRSKPDLREAASWGIVSGGFACYYLGGTYFEKKQGEKFSHIRQLYDKYLIQTGK